jgi:hypothetical protein
MTQSWTMPSRATPASFEYIDVDSEAAGDTAPHPAEREGAAHARTSATARTPIPRRVRFKSRIADG